MNNFIAQVVLCKLLHAFKSEEKCPWQLEIGPFYCLGIVLLGICLVFIVTQYPVEDKQFYRTPRRWDYSVSMMKKVVTNTSCPNTDKAWILSKPAVPDLFGTRDWFCERQIFHRQGVGG